MHNKLCRNLLTIVSIMLLIGGVIFLYISIWGDGSISVSLPIALGCIGIANLISAFRLLRSKKEQSEKIITAYSSQRRKEV